MMMLRYLGRIYREFILSLTFTAFRFCHIPLIPLPGMSNTLRRFYCADRGRFFTFACVASTIMSIIWTSWVSTNVAFTTNLRDRFAMSGCPSLKRISDQGNHSRPFHATPFFQVPSHPLIVEIGATLGYITLRVAERGSQQSRAQTRNTTVHMHINRRYWSYRKRSHPPSDSETTTSGGVYGVPPL